MKISDFISGGKVNSPNIKTLTKPILGILIIFILLVLLFKFGFSKIRMLIGEYKTANEVETMLASKLSQLASDNQTSLENANKLVIALPEKNSAMVMISQMKRLAFEKNLTLGKLEISGLRNTESLNSVQLTAEVSALDLANLLDYFRNLLNLAPVSSVFEVKISSENGSKLGGSVELSVYWSDFPLTIPAVREPVTSLSDSELSVLQSISNLREPEYQVLEPLTQPDRVEPFN